MKRFYPAWAKAKLTSGVKDRLPGRFRIVPRDQEMKRGNRPDILAQENPWDVGQAGLGATEVGQCAIADVQGTQLPQHFPAARASQTKNGVDTGDINSFGRNRIRGFTQDQIVSCAQTP